MRKLKDFILAADRLIGISFFTSQSRASNVLKDIVFSVLYRLARDFNSISGTVKLSFSANNKKLELRNRSNSDYAQYSSGYELDDIPTEFKTIIDENKKVIEEYVGKQFLYEKPLVFRNYNFDEVFCCYDIYSNIWHQDSHDGNRLLKIFVLLHDTDDSHGPFHYLEFSFVKKYWSILKDRYSFNSMKNLAQFEEQTKIIGKAGNYVILDTSRCSHRASIPKEFRDMMNITLYPKWRKSSNRYKYP